MRSLENLRAELHGFNLGIERAAKLIEQSFPARVTSAEIRALEYPKEELAVLDKPVTAEVGRKESRMVYRVVETANPLVTPFPDNLWHNKEDAEKFANEDAPDGWAGKLTVVESTPD